MSTKRESGFIPWNKGLTKKTSIAIQEQAHRKSIWWRNLKEKFPKKYKELCKNTGGKSAGKPGLKMEKNPSWKGGRRIDKRDGYVLVQMPWHPDSRKRGDILEHRVIMEKIIGRRLLKNEDVNHINGIKHDNRPKNLRLVKHFAHYEEHKCPKCKFVFRTQ